MAERFEYAFPDGRRFDGGDKSAEEIRAAYPDAVITHVVTLDEDGKFVRRDPFTSKQPKAKAVATEGTTTTTTTTPAPAKGKSK